MGHVKIVRASAGSGKTFRLVLEYLTALVDQPAAYRHTLAVTFTNKATGEMKERIVQQLHALSSGEASPYEEPLRRASGLTADEVRRRAAVAQGMILHDYSHFAVLTIDKFFQNIIRSFLRELGISPNFSIELRTDTLLEQAADALVELSASDPALEAWIGEFAMEQMEESAGWDVRRKLTKAGGEVFGEEWMRGGTAGREALGEAVGRATAQCAAATGKIENLARQAMALIDSNGLSVDDFSYKKSGAAGFLDRTARGESEDYAVKNYVVRTLKGGMAWAGKNSPAEARIEAIAPQLDDLLGQIAAIWDNERSLLNTTAILRRRWRSFGLLDDISKQVECLAAEGNVVPIARTNKLLSELIAGNEIPFIFEKAGERFTRFLIDEFQDTSRGQWENFIPLLQNALAQSAGAPVLLVGDVKQSIYRWRGGDWQILASGAAGALGEARLDALEDNRRSLERVVTFNNTLIGQCVAHDTAALDEMLLKAEDEGYLPRAKREELLTLLPGAYYGHAQNPMPDKQGGYVTVTLRAAVGKDEQPEGPDPVILRVEELQARGFAPADIAILVRRRAEAQAIARLLLDHKAANPG
ncbi:MAG: UvrD-helicase domain-containing protein, partial [Rikenellaceae bacterium]|nr:UvrD-helicase domain-containing protein [Rikenellaceae bacterium]